MRDLSDTDGGPGTRTQRYAAPAAGSQPRIRSRATPSYRQASHLPHEARPDDGQYQHAQPITPIGQLNGRAADALQKFTRPTTAPNAWDEDSPTPISGGGLLHGCHLLQARPTEVMTPASLGTTPGTAGTPHSATNASVRLRGGSSGSSPMPVQCIGHERQRHEPNSDGQADQQSQ
jgi:hypothetical protein